MINQYYNKSKIEIYIKDIISISINILEDNLSTSSLKEETVLYTILSILTHSNKEWDIYSEYINLVNIIINLKMIYIPQGVFISIIFKNLKKIK